MQLPARHKTEMFLVYLMVGLFLLSFLQALVMVPGAVEIPYSRLVQLVKEGKVESTVIGADEIHVTLKSGIETDEDLKKLAEQQRPFFPLYRMEDSRPVTFKVTRLPGVEKTALVQQMLDAGVTIRGDVENTFWNNLLFGWILPIAAMMLFWQFLMRRVSQNSSLTSPLTLGKNRAKIYSENDIKVTFDDVAGVEEAKAELREIVDFLKQPARYQALGGRIPKGVLLVGPPGTGKTLLARAIAGEAKVPFFSISGSEFIEMFVGVGAARVRDLFEQAKQKAPCIIFIDELDAVGKSGLSASAPFGRHDEQEQTLNQLLVEMDGFDPSKGVILLAATNRPEVLDPALLRAGRFDRRVVVDLPDVAGRLQILQVHARRVRLAPDVDLRTLAARTPGFSGADLANLMNEAALLAVREGKEAVDQTSLDRAADRLMAGLERKSRVLSPRDRDIVAIHEIGHALVALLSKHADRVHKVSIIPRSIGALGFTMQLPTEDRYLMTRSELEDKIAVLLGGRVAEEIVFKEASTGAQDDLQKATRLARHMVCLYGMSEALGPQAFADPQGGLYLREKDRPLPSGMEYSERTAERIDAEVAQILEKLHQKVTALLMKNQETLRWLADRLKERETLEGAELMRLLAERNRDGNDATLESNAAQEEGFHDAILSAPAS